MFRGDMATVPSGRNGSDVPGFQIGKQLIQEWLMAYDVGPDGNILLH